MRQVPLVDLRVQHAQIAEEVERGFARVFDETAFILGKDVADFEDRFAQFVGVDHCIGVGNGTDALELALRAVGVGPGDEVILPTNSFIATALAAARIGAVPVLADCDPDFFLLDPEQVQARIGPRTRAIVPVHLYGQMAPMAALEKLASDAGIPLVEDAAQAQGATQDGRGAGSVGAAAGTSFYPGKNLGAYGDAGAVLTDDEALAAHVRKLRSYGSEQKYEHPEIGFNSRLDTLQAVVLRAKLPLLPLWNELRCEAAARYDTLLDSLEPVITPRALPENAHVWHLYVVRVPERDRVLQALQRAGIGSGIHYPIPIHLAGAFGDLGYGPGSFPVAEKLAGEILSLPLYPGIGEDQQTRVAEELARCF
jgi:dTDP-4-amino-4,6-dideoxygalactose transaminase